MPRETQPESTYQPLVSQLLKLGKPSVQPDESGVLDYLGMGLSKEHVTELIRMSLDDELDNAPEGSDVMWAPIHAWRALGQLEAQEAIEPLLGLLRRIDENDDEWVMSELPSVFAGIGPATIPAVAGYLADSSNPEHARICASSALAEIAVCHPEYREECIGRMSSQLERFREQDRSFNAFLICDLLDVQAGEAAPIIEKAFVGNKVDESIAGTWQDSQVTLGLKERKSAPRRRY